jgi:hypothetical protein
MKANHPNHDYKQVRASTSRFKNRLDELLPWNWMADIQRALSC